ncbi:hypothetical protein [Catellatospora tritici]|uniref:hypothetical protein n=1 Tax=Catellatospora tritici TaxID=2851566 RepID=UPI001C2D486C|nr:hypothetical protein [Catellatospora tritici]MBV1855079.1 hypothetical protein [Catellatospora tritici]
MLLTRPRRRALLFVLIALAAAASQVAAVNVPESQLVLEDSLRFGPSVVGLAVLVYVNLRPSGSDARFAVTGHGFTTSSRSWRRWAFVLVLVQVHAIANQLDRGPRYGLVVGLLILAGVGMFGAMMWCDVPRLELRPNGVRLSLLRSREIPWPQLRRQFPPTSEASSSAAARQPERSRRDRDRARDRDPAEGWDADPRFVAAAIRWYLDHPEHRDAIGTQAEHDRLVSALADSQSVGDIGALA